MKNKTPLLDALDSYINKGYYPLHTPGHKQGRYFSPKMKEMFQSVLSMDLTELPGLDDLHQPAGVIAQSQQRAAKLFNAKRTFYSVQGATVGIHAAMMALGNTGEDFVISRHSHRSVYSGLILTGCNPVYLPQGIDEYWGFVLGNDLKRIKEDVLKYQKKTLLLTNPTYEGVNAPIEKILACLDSPAAAVDESHGAHYTFHSQLPVSALNYDVDFVVHGSHKTLPTLTQTAMVHAVREDYIRQMIGFLDMLQTSSPSYLLLASLDGAQEYLGSCGRSDWDEALEVANGLRRYIRQLPELELLEEEHVQGQGMSGLDKTRITVSSSKIDGGTLKRLMRKEKLEVELAGIKHVVLIVTPGMTENELTFIKGALRNVSTAIPKETSHEEMLKVKLRTLVQALQPPEVILNPRQATYSNTRRIALAHAEGAIAAEFIIPYPPGIPLVVPGEKITYETQKAIKDLLDLKIHFQGTFDPSIEKILIVE